MLLLSFFNTLEVYVIKDLLINEDIRAREVRLIDSDGEQLGIVSSKEANQIAFEKRMDLVLIAPQAKPPVCKIMDYGKYCYELQKREKEAKKKQKTIEVKEIRFSPSIDTHDLEVKARQANKFLKNGDRVKVSVRFRGRELGHTELGREVLDDFADLTSENGVIEKAPKMEGRNMVMFLEQRQDD